MKVHVLARSQRLPCAPDEVFPFFADAFNLEPPMRFVDVQVRGPYRLWHHTHSFEPDGDGTVMRDRVRYALPLGPLGEVAHALLVRRDLDRIFAVRHAVVRARLG